MISFFTSKSRVTVFTLITIFIALGISALLYAYGTGVSGCTLKTHSTGCNCHSSNPNTAVVVTLAGPDTVLVNSTSNFTFSVSRSSGTFSTGGVDVAVSTGTLGIGTSTGIKMLNSEIVHSSKFTSATTKTFTFTAPSTPGTVTMYCTGAGGTGTPPWNNAANKTIVVKNTTGIENKVTPVSFSLSQNYPNPFNPITNIKFDVPKNSLVTLKVYNIVGQEVNTLVNEIMNAGSYESSFDGSELSSGIYFYKLMTNDFVAVKKMSLIK